jgi:DNA adenine methylase
MQVLRRNPEHARPFLKWAGGKSQLLLDLRARLPASFGGYHEPFLGGGALYFDLMENGRLRGGAQLSDVNTNLLDAWIALRDDVEGVISALQNHPNDERHFYAVRAQEPADLSLVERAARVIFLNKTGFNGLYRENSSGRFNVPFGRYANPPICDEPNLRAVSRALQGTSIEVRDFRAVIDRAKAGDLVYFDPPYAPVSTTSSFTAYAKGGGFGEAEQRALRDTALELARGGVHVVLSNSDVPLIRELYRDFQVDVVLARRNINSKADRRGEVQEVIARPRIDAPPAAGGFGVGGTDTTPVSFGEREGR